jgi:hypothetical protein
MSFLVKHRKTDGNAVHFRAASIFLMLDIFRFYKVLIPGQKRIRVSEDRSSHNRNVEYVAQLQGVAHVNELRRLNRFERKILEKTELYPAAFCGIFVRRRFAVP